VLSWALLSQSYCPGVDNRINTSLTASHVTNLLSSIQQDDRCEFLGTFVKFAKSEHQLRYVCLPACPSVRTLETSRLSLHEFVYDLGYEDFSKICRETSILIKI